MIAIGKKADKTKEAGHCIGTLALQKRQADKVASGSGAAAAIDPGMPHQALLYKAQFFIFKNFHEITIFFTIFS